MKSQAERPKKKTPAAQTVRFVLILSALLLPTLSLVPLGGMYLWEHELLLHWAAFAMASVAIVYAAQRFLFVEPVSEKASSAELPEPGRKPDAGWTPIERQAWADVSEIAKSANADRLGEVDYLLELSQKTLSAVARRLHPEKPDAVWRFTLPEALAISEQVSRRLNQFAQRNLPFADRLTVSQILNIYRWRHAVDVADKMYAVWRVIRLTNPAAAVTNEARERMTRALMQWGREHVTRRLAETFVQEVGRAAIDLYGGRLRVAADPTVDVDELIRAGELSADAWPVGAINVAVLGADGAALSKIAELIRSGATAGDGTNAGMTSIFESLHRVVSEVPVGDMAQIDAVALGRAIAASDILVWVIGSQGHDTSVAAAMSRLFQATPQSAPILMPVVLHHQVPLAGAQDAASEARHLLAVEELRDAYGRMTGPLTVIESRLDAMSNTDAQRMFANLDAALPAAVRVQLARKLGGAPSPRGMVSSVKQAATSAGRLLRSLTIGSRAP